MENKEYFHIRLAGTEDLETLMRIYGHAKEFMARHGNPEQWTGGYPSEKLIESEIEAGHSFVCETADGKIAGTFCFITGEDPTYQVIEHGRWLADGPYGTIHRLASAGIAHGVAEACMEWCWQRMPNLRADTHSDNAIMQKILEKAGFTRCGIIYTDNGSPRIAYQRIRSLPNIRYNHS